MTQAVAGYNGKFYVSTDSGASYQLVGELRDVELNRTAKMLDATTHASGGDEEYKPGNRGWTANAGYLAIYSDAAQTAIRNAITPGTRLKFRFDPAGTATGLEREEGFGYVEGLKIKSPNQDLVQADVTIRGDGPLTLSTQP